MQANLALVGDGGIILYCLEDHPGTTKEGVHWLLDWGVKLIGIDAIGFNPLIDYVFQRSTP